MKVAVYTIALNELQFVKRWYESAKDADYLLIADTGSTDGTQDTASKLDINVYDISIKPWRFDLARNAALALIPKDIDFCIALDMDEILLPGWRQELEKVYNTDVTRPRYKYTWSWNLDGSPGLQYGGDKIHLRNGYIWKHPVHEVITADRITEVQGWINLEIHHHPDDTKSRGQYLPLLELSVKEDPINDRNSFYYARELFFHGRIEDSIKEFKRHLGLPTSVWKPERAASMRYLAKMHTNQDREYWLQLANKEDPTRREALVELSQYYYETQNWEQCYNTSKLALSISEKPLDYLCEEFAWGFAPYDFAALAAYNLGNIKEAAEYGKKAIEINPTEERLKRNLEFYTAEEI